MTPAPSTRHQTTVGNLSFLLRSYLQDHPVGRLYFAPTDVLLPGDLATPVQPDLLLLKNENLERVKEAYIDGAPDWIAEVLSPSNWLDDRREKYRLYAAAGVTEYWIVDLQQEIIEVFHLRDGGYELVGRFGEGEIVRSVVFPEFEPEVEEILRE
jgi:Uma2 family endonuclease